MIKFLLGFKYAFSGIWYCIKTQRNFRFHTAAALAAILLSSKYNLFGYEKILLAFTIAFVIIIEMINTAIEAVVDMNCTSFNKFAKIAKDVCAGAVLISVFSSLVTAMVVFYKDGKFWYIMSEYVKCPLFWIFAVVCLVYIFGFNYIFGGKTSDK